MEQPLLTTAKGMNGVLLLLFLFLKENLVRSWSKSESVEGVPGCINISMSIFLCSLSFLKELFTFPIVEGKTGLFLLLFIKRFTLDCDSFSHIFTNLTLSIVLAPV